MITKKEGYGINYKINSIDRYKKQNKKIVYSVFLPIKKNKIKKPNIRGLWQNKNKIYYDYLIIKNYEKINTKKLNYLKNKYNQLCLFYKTNKGVAYIYYNPYKIIKLRVCIFQNVKKDNLKNEVKKTLKNNGGLTIHKIGFYYLLESWR